MGTTHRGRVITPAVFDAESEAAVIGMMLLDPAVVPVCIRDLRETDFYVGKNRAAFNAIKALFTARRAFDIVTVASKMQSDGFTRNEAIMYLSRLESGAFSVDALGEHIKAVRDCTIRRRVLADIRRLRAAAGNANVSAEELAAQLQHAATETGIEVSRGMQTASLNSVLAKSWELLEQRISNSHAVVGVPTGIHRLDELTGGLRDGELTVLSGWTGRGKSAFAEQIMLGAVQRGIPTLLFSLEMSHEAVGDRILSRLAQVDLLRIRTGRLSGGDKERIVMACSERSNDKLYVCAPAYATATQVAATARLAQAQYGIRFVVVDYLTLLAPEDSERRRIERRHEVNDHLRMMVHIARELRCPLLLLAQLARPDVGQGGTEPRPSLFKLKETGEIENTAHLILLLHRDEYQKPDKLPNEYERATIEVAKQRNGPAGVLVPVLFDGAHVRFLNPTDVESEQAESRA